MATKRNNDIRELEGITIDTSNCLLPFYQNKESDVLAEAREKAYKAFAAEINKDIVDKILFGKF